MDFKYAEPVRAWCQKVLPTVFDDSLSYYELLCKIAHELNIVIDNTNNIPEYIEQAVIKYVTQGAFEEMLKKYSATYIEVDHKIKFGGGTSVMCCEHIYTPDNKTITIIGR